MYNDRSTTYSPHRTHHHHSPISSASAISDFRNIKFSNIHSTNHPLTSHHAATAASTDRLNTLNRGKDGIFRPKSIFSIATEIDFDSSSYSPTSSTRSVPTNPRLAYLRDNNNRSNYSSNNGSNPYSSSSTSASDYVPSYSKSNYGSRHSNTSSNYGKNSYDLPSSSTSSSTNGNYHRFTNAYHAPKYRERPLLSNLDQKFGDRRQSSATPSSTSSPLSLSPRASIMHRNSSEHIHHTHHHRHRSGSGSGTMTGSPPIHQSSSPLFHKDSPTGSINSSQSSSITDINNINTNQSSASSSPISSRRQSQAGLERNKFLIKFREHEKLSLKNPIRRSSISWDIPYDTTHNKLNDNFNNFNKNNETIKEDTEEDASAETMDDQKQPANNSTVESNVKSLKDSKDSTVNNDKTVEIKPKPHTLTRWKGSLNLNDDVVHESTMNVQNNGGSSGGDNRYMVNDETKNAKNKSKTIPNDDLNVAEPKLYKELRLSTMMNDGNTSQIQRQTNENLRKLPRMNTFDLKPKSKPLNTLVVVDQQQQETAPNKKKPLKKQQQQQPLANNDNTLNNNQIKRTKSVNTKPLKSTTVIQIPVNDQRIEMKLSNNLSDKSLNDGQKPKTNLLTVDNLNNDGKPLLKPLKKSATSQSIVELSSKLSPVQSEDGTKKKMKSIESSNDESKDAKVKKAITKPEKLKIPESNLKPKSIVDDLKKENQPKDTKTEEKSKSPIVNKSAVNEAPKSPMISPKSPNELPKTPKGVTKSPKAMNELEPKSPVVSPKSTANKTPETPKEPPKSPITTPKAAKDEPKSPKGDMPKSPVMTPKSSTDKILKLSKDTPKSPKPTNESPMKSPIASPKSTANEAMPKSPVESLKSPQDKTKSPKPSTNEMPKSQLLSPKPTIESAKEEVSKSTKENQDKSPKTPEVVVKKAKKKTSETKANDEPKVKTKFSFNTDSNHQTQQATSPKSPSPFKSNQQQPQQQQQQQIEKSTSQVVSKAEKSVQQSLNQETKVNDAVNKVVKNINVAKSSSNDTVTTSTTTPKANLTAAPVVVTATANKSKSADQNESKSAAAAAAKQQHPITKNNQSSRSSGSIADDAAKTTTDNKPNAGDVEANRIQIKINQQDPFQRQRNAHQKKIRFREYCIDDFTFLTVLGRGSFGKVLLAELNNHGCHFAVKCLKKITVIEDDDVESIMIERKVLAYGTSHPFICKLFCTFQTESHLFFAMELCSGGDLMFHVQKEGKFPESKAKFYATEMICALWFLHKRGIIYRDLKLDNVMVANDGHIRLVDFGMCVGKMYREELLPSNFCGTPEYMAPEIIKGIKYNHSVDYWALGVVIYEMCVGTSPFNGGDEDELLWNVCNTEVHYPKFLSEQVKQLIVLLLKKNPQERLGLPDSPAGDIVQQQWFHGVQWDLVEKCRCKPPFIPQLSHDADVSYFDHYFTKEIPCITPCEKQISENDQQLFQGFNYTNHRMTE